MTTVYFDIETDSAEGLYTTPPEKFFRIGGYKYKGRKTVHITEDLEEMRQVLRAADLMIGHNIWSFDLPAIFGIDSNEWLAFGEDHRVIDTWTHAVLVHPAPFIYENRKGKRAKAETPEQMKAWFSLDEQAFQLGVPGKTHDLNALAKKYGGYGEIPKDDPEYREYLTGDVLASEHVCEALLALSPMDAYAWREQRIESRKSVIQCNGMRTDLPKAQARVDELAQRREQIMDVLVEHYDFPTEGKSPWASTAGKEAILAALADHGVTEKTRPDWTKTPAGALSLSGPVLLRITEGTEAEGLGAALAELKGQRSLAQLAIDSTHSDGYVHPEITMLQRSGRWSTTKPGLTVWTARGEGAVEKAYFIPDRGSEVFLEFDYSNADARMVAAFSGDEAFAERFEPGADGHMINAIAAWGAAVVATDPDGYRQRAKVPGHGWGYKIGAKTLNRQTGMPEDEARLFLQGMNRAFPGVVRWQRECTQEALRNGWVTGGWGRRMYVEPGREYTQAPALKGQNGTREIVCDAILGMPVETLRRLKAQIHDALLFSVPRKNWEAWRDHIIECMEPEYGFKPKYGGQRIDFPVSSGKPGNDWYEAGH